MFWVVLNKKLADMKSEWHTLFEEKKKNLNQSLEVAPTSEIF